MPGLFTSDASFKNLRMLKIMHRRNPGDDFSRNLGTLYACCCHRLPAEQACQSHPAVLLKGLQFKETPDESLQQVGAQASRLLHVFCQCAARSAVASDSSCSFCKAENVNSKQARTRLMKEQDMEGGIHSNWSRLVNTQVGFLPDSRHASQVFSKMLRSTAH